MFDIKVALRFLKEGKGQTLLIVIGISIGIAVQVFLNGLINGLQDNLIDSTIGTSPHITAESREIKPRNLIAQDSRTIIIEEFSASDSPDKPIMEWSLIEGQINRLPSITAISPSIRGSGFINKGGKNLPTAITGLEIEKADNIYNINERLLEGDSNIMGNEMLVGINLAEDLFLQTNGIARIRLPNGEIDTFTIKGIFDFESEAANRQVIIPLNRAQAFYDTRGGVTNIELQITDPFMTEELTALLNRSYPDLEWSSWQEANASLLSALQSQSGSSYVIQFFVILAVTLGISSVLAVSAVQKSKQIGILKALGCTTDSISRIFLIQGGILGFSGAILGNLIGFSIIQMFLYFTELGTGEPLFPIQFTMQNFIFSSIIATVAGTLAAAVPARKSASLNPVEVIKNG